MTARYYDFYGARESAATIVQECVLYGKSEGWAGNDPEFSEVKEICADFNVRYVDDWFGEWKLVKE